jgi:hypothetical protein
VPEPQDILKALEKIANDWRFLAVFWHLYFGLFGAIFLLRIHRSRRYTGIWLLMPRRLVVQREMLVSDPAARLREAPAGEFCHARCSLLRSKGVRINGVRGVGMAGGDWIKNRALENCCEGDFFGGFLSCLRSGGS